MKTQNSYRGPPSTHLRHLMVFQEVGEESIKNSEHIDKTKINNRQVANEYPI